MIQIKAEAFACLNGTIEGLRKALQTAIELEHSTIPPYLYALYSLKPGTNGEIGRLLLSVIQQEMLHMALDCNILNAINGSPDIDKPHFIPKYPGPLPGSDPQTSVDEPDHVTARALDPVFCAQSPQRGTPAPATRQ